MRLRYTRRALADLEKALVYITERSRRGARNVERRIQTAIALLPQYPELGRLTKRRGVRRLVVVPYPYLVFYRIDADEIVIRA